MVATENAKIENGIMNQNDAMTVDYSEYVKSKAKAYAEALYEAAEEPVELSQELDRAIYRAIVEADGLSWDELAKYEDRFIEIVETELWDMRIDWEGNYCSMITEEYQKKVEDYVEYVSEPSRNVGCLERVRGIYGKYWEELSVIGIGGIEDFWGLGLDLSCLGGNFDIAGPDGADMEEKEWQLDYLDQRIAELEEELDYMEYKLVQR